MKKVLSLTLAMVLVLTLLALPASAKTTYTYKSYTITDVAGDNYTFSAASTGYNLHSMTMEQNRDTLVILKSGSTVTVKEGNGTSEGFLTWGIWGENTKGDVVGGAGVYGTLVVERIYDYHCNSFGYDIEDTLASISTKNGTVFFMLESAAERHSNMVTLAGEEPEITKPGLAIQFDDDYYMSDIGPINDLTITNNTDKAVNGVYTLLLYSPKKYCLACVYGPKYYAHEDKPSAEIYLFDLNLAPGESITKSAYFLSERNLTRTKFVWVEYDDAAERDACLADSALFRTDTVDYAKSYDNYVGYWMVIDDAYLSRYPYDITLAPVTHKSN